MAEQDITPTEVQGGESVADKLRSNIAPAAPREEVVVAEVAKPSLTEKLRDLGFQGVEKDDEALERLLAAYEQEKKRAAESETIARALAAERVAPPKAEATPEPEKPRTTWWNPPKVDQTLIQAFQVPGPDGRPTFRDNTPPEVLRQAELATAHYQKWARDIIERPDVVLPQIIREEAERLFEEKFNSVQQKTKQEGVREQFLRENGDWLFAKDPLTGQQGDLTPEGKKYDAWLSEAYNLGIEDFGAQIKYANAMRSADAATRAAAAAQTPKPEETNETKKLDLLRRGGGNPDRGGTFPAPGAKSTPPQNRNLSVAEKLRDRMRQNGVLIPS